MGEVGARVARGQPLTTISYWKAATNQRCHAGCWCRPATVMPHLGLLRLRGNPGGPGTPWLTFFGPKTAMLKQQSSSGVFDVMSARTWRPRCFYASTNYGVPVLLVPKSKTSVLNLYSPRCLNLSCTKKVLSFGMPAFGSSMKFSE